MMTYFAAGLNCDSTDNTPQLSCIVLKTLHCHVMIFFYYYLLGLYISE